MTAPTGYKSVLYLEHGHIFEGIGYGAERTTAGEIVFNTGMSGYQEIFTDPSYCKQIVVMTQPHIGNTGVNWDDPESRSLYLSGVVARELTTNPSSWRSKQTLHEYLNRAEVPLISDVDTRHLTRIIREEGAQRAVIFPARMSSHSTMTAHARQLMKDVPGMEGLELVSQVSCKEPYLFNEDRSRDVRGPVIAVYDFGVKLNILRHFSRRGFRVHVVPHNFPHQEVLSLRPCALVLSNGPGDPALVDTREIQALVGQVPLFAICMGHQVLARALGATTYKLKFGHHGINHPVKDLSTQRILITSQNHGFAVSAESLKIQDVRLKCISLNDATVEGFESERLRLSSYQFHPEARPGPHDASYLFDDFLRHYES